MKSKLLVFLLQILMFLVTLNYSQVYWTNSNNCNLAIYNNTVATIILNQNIINTTNTPCISLSGFLYNVSLTINLNNKTINKTGNFILLNNIAVNSSQFCQERNVTIRIENGTINTSHAIIYQANNGTARQVILIRNTTLNSKFFYHGGNGSCLASPNSYLNFSQINTEYLFNLTKRGQLAFADPTYFSVEYNNISVKYLFTTYNSSTPFADINYDMLTPNAQIRYNNITMEDNRLSDVIYRFSLEPPWDSGKLLMYNNNIIFRNDQLYPYVYDNGSVVNNTYVYIRSYNNLISHINYSLPTPSTSFKTLPAALGSIWNYYPMPPSGQTEACLRPNGCPAAIINTTAPFVTPIGTFMRLEDSVYQYCGDDFFPNVFGGDNNTVSQQLYLNCRINNSLNKNITFQVFAGQVCREHSSDSRYKYYMHVFLFVPNSSANNKSIYSRALDYFPEFVQNNNSYLYCNFFNYSNNTPINNTPFITTLSIRALPLSYGANGLYMNLAVPSHNISALGVSYPRALGFVFNNTYFEQTHTQGTSASPLTIGPPSQLGGFLGFLITTVQQNTNSYLTYIPIGLFGYSGWAWGSYWRSAGYMFRENDIVPTLLYSHPSTSNNIYFTFNLPATLTNSYLYRFVLKNAKNGNYITEARVSISSLDGWGVLLFSQADGSATTTLRPNSVYIINITKSGYYPLYFTYIPSLQQEVTLYMQPIEGETGGSQSSFTYETFIHEVLANANYFTSYNKTTKVYTFRWNSTDSKIQYGETKCYNTTKNYYILYNISFGNGSSNSTSMILPANSTYVCENILFVGYGVAVIKDTIAEATSWTNSLNELALFMSIVIVLTVVGAFAFAPTMAVIASTMVVLLLGFTGIILLPSLAYAGLVLVATIIILVMLRKSQYWV